MVAINLTPAKGGLQPLAGNDRDHLAEVLDSVDASSILHTLQRYRWTGRKGYSLSALWRAYLASLVLNLPHTNALIRQLAWDEELREICGFNAELPHRTTFNRFIQRLADHAGLVQECFTQITGELRKHFPNFGREVAVDSSVFRSHSNPNRNRNLVSDPDASWTAKTSAQAKNGKEWFWGYKLHMVADVNTGFPLSFTVTTASSNDGRFLLPLVDECQTAYPWLRIRTVVADQGYDTVANSEELHARRIAPVIHIKKPRRTADGERDWGVYTAKGTPTCMGNVPMEYVETLKDKGHLYRCRIGGCHLANSFTGGVLHCDSTFWVDFKEDIRRFGGRVRRDSRQWATLYAKRQSVERTFKSLKESRRLNRHCVRGLKKATLHASMSVLSYQATALTKMSLGQEDKARWMVPLVA